MSMEKRGVIEEGETPREKGADSLEEHMTKRAADVARESVRQGRRDPSDKKQPE